MAADLTRAKDALEALTDIELRALKMAASEIPQVAPDLLAWIEDACDWEIDRRAGRDYYLEPPEAAIYLSKDAISVKAAMRESFATGGFATAALRFLDALAPQPTGEEQKH